MKNKAKFLLIGYFCSIISIVANAQVADSVQLEEIIITEDPFLLLSKTATSRIGRIKLNQLNSNKTISDVLQGESGLFLRNQGAGLLSTVSFNGFSPSQIRIEWNGMELNHSMVGLVDANLIPSSFLSSVDFATSYISASSGTMAMGGIISMTSTKPKSNFGVAYTYNSMQNHRIETIIPLGKQSSVQLFVAENQNKFTYYDPVFNSSQQRKHNNSQQIGILAQHNSTWFKKSLQTSLWIQKVEKEIPGPIGTPVSNANQTDGWIRLSNNLLLETGKNPWKIQHNLSLDQLDYLDPNLERFGSDELSWSRSYKHQIRTTKRLFFIESLWSDLTLDRLDVWVNTNNYSNVKYRGVSKIITHTNWQISQRLVASQITQIEHFSDFGWTFSPSLGLNFSLIKNQLNLYSNVSKTYSPPSFNDLYWPKLGNPDLVAQSAIKWESGYSWNWKGESNTISNDSYILFAQVEQGIQWIPIAGEWRPENVLATNQRAINSHTSWENSALPIHFRWSFDLNVTQALVSKQTETNQNTIGKQLIFVPDAMFKTAFQVIYNQYDIKLDYQRVGNRYINASNTDWLNPYQVVNVAFNTSFSFSSINLKFGLQVQNLLNEAYDIMRFYPLPDRVYQTTIKISLK